MGAITGTAGDDFILGSSGPDTIFGLGGNDSIAAGAGDDSIDGGAGNDVLEGGYGNDRLYDASGINEMAGGHGADILDATGSDGAILMSHLYSTFENTDVLSQRDTLIGGEGNDFFRAGFNDSVYGGGGANMLDLNLLGSTQGVFLDLRPLAKGQAVLNGAGKIVGISGLYQVKGTAFSDTIIAFSEDATPSGNRLFGEGGDDSLQGGAGADIIAGGEGSDVLDGAGGNDFLSSSLWDDLASGSDRTMEVDSLRGGDGDDALLAGLGDMVTGGEGTDRIYLDLSGGQAGVTMSIADLGTAEGLNILGGRVAQVEIVSQLRLPDFDNFVSLEGQLAGSSLEIWNGDALVYGGASVDVLVGSAARDSFFGGAGDDLLRGADGDDALDGGSGNDTLEGGSGYNVLAGGDGSDTVDYAKSLRAISVFLDTGAASDFAETFDSLSSVENAVGSQFNDLLRGGLGANALFGGEGNDRIEGGGGEDLLAGGAGDDLVDGGSGTDTMTYFDAAATVKVDLSLVSPQSTGGAGRDTLTNVENLVGSNFNDTLLGNGSDNRLAGGAGDDTLLGGQGSDILDGAAGRDRLNGGAGADVLRGGIGEDSYTVDDAADMIVEFADEGTDSVSASVSYTLQDNVEKLTLTGSADTHGTGNALANTLTGNAGINWLEGLGGKDYLDGKAGADMMAGGQGDDTYVVDTKEDQVIEEAGEGSDTVKASVTYMLRESVEKLVLLSNGAIDGFGNSGANSLTGNGSDNHLYGFAGKDSLVGGAGSDQLSGGLGADTLTGGTGADLFLFDVLESSAGKDTIKDFEHGSDRLAFSRSVFTALGDKAGGFADTDHFVRGAAAMTSGQHLIYNPSTGALFYDADGVGGAAQIQVAVLSTKPFLDAGDLFLI